MGKPPLRISPCIPRILSGTKGETVESPKTVTYQPTDNGASYEPAQDIQVKYYNSQLFFKNTILLKTVWEKPTFFMLSPEV